MKWVFFQLALLLLHVSLRLRNVGSVEQVVAVGHQALLVQLPAPLRREGCLVVLHGRAQLLLVSVHQPGIYYEIVELSIIR